jgi:hypothetical protein
VFLARTREILRKVCTKETYLPLIDETAKRPSGTARRFGRS